MSGAERKPFDWREQYEETAERLHAAGDFTAADDMRTLVDGLVQHEREAEALAVRVAEAEKALAAVKENAEAWHGNGEDGPRRALAVIARCCEKALAGGGAVQTGAGGDG